MGGNKKKIGWIQSTMIASGGLVHDKKVMDILSREFDLEVVDASIKNYKNYMFPRVIYGLSKIQGKKDLWIRGFEGTISMPFDKTHGKNLVLVYHIDRSTRPLYVRPFYYIMEKIFYRNLKKVEVVVTICKEFYNQFGEKGLKDVRIVYPGYDISQFKFTDDEVQEFKKRYGLLEKPIIYIGNCQKAKGVVESYDALRYMDVHLVTSGDERVRIPARNLNLSYRDYLLLLRASSVVVVMSKFLEGWLLTAHEAMLCKTPVVGSPGLRAILEDGGQIVCDDFSKLRQNVEYLMKHPEVGERGYDYVKQFTDERFEKEWLGLVREVI
ncbi:MAG: glycosyltransferase family 4 protein [Candidatus Altiarchaeota archaeon]